MANFNTEASVDVSVSVSREWNNFLRFIGINRSLL